MAQSTPGKLSARDEAISRVLKWSPALAFILLSLPLPIVFLLLFIMSTAADAAAVYLFLTMVSMGLGVLIGLVAVLVIFLYRRSWLRRLRDRLAADGITANEVQWFTSELTSAERKSLSEIRNHNPLLADAYLETLASRLTATRIRSRATQELLRVERRINRARTLVGVDTADLLRDLESDRERYTHLKSEASSRLTEAKARLQTIEAASSRTMNQLETDLMLRRLSAAQDQLPLVMQMAKLEEEALQETRTEIEKARTSQLD